MTIDTHFHFWDYDAKEFGWIPDAWSSIRKDFGPADLEPILKANGVDYAIAVQARCSVEETQWLLRLTQEHRFIRGVVGWLDLHSPDIAAQLKGYAGTHLVGLRAILQGQPDVLMENADFNRGLRAMADAGLTYDLLITEKQFPAAIRLVDQHPNLRIILDHFGKPRLDIDQLEPWKTHMKELGKRANVWCKISGGITEIALDWTPHRMNPFLDTALESFGAKRLVFGSNWPVCNPAGGYGPWLRALGQWASVLSSAEQQGIFGGNAVECYQMK
jgi:L-fuconolactonase